MRALKAIEILPNTFSTEKTQYIHVILLTGDYSGFGPKSVPELSGQNEISDLKKMKSGKTLF